MYAILQQVFPASTDARFVRAAKIPAFGFSPMRYANRCVLMYVTTLLCDCYTYVDVRMHTCPHTLA